MIPEPIKDKFIQELERTALVAAACRAAGISRATVYRWRDADKEFAKRMDIALEYGRGDWCDLAESKLVTAVKRGEPWAIRYTLEFNHPRYYKPRKAIAAPPVQRTVNTVRIEILDSEGKKVSTQKPFVKIKRSPKTPP